MPRISIKISLTDSLGNTATPASIAVGVVNGPILTAPTSELIGVSKSAAITGVSVAESGAQPTDPVTVNLTDAHGDLSVTTTGVTVTGNGGTNLTVSGGYAAVNTALATLAETDGTPGSDPITVTATDQFGFTAGAKTIGVTVTGLPVVSAPGALIVATGIARSVAGVSVSEANAPSTEMVTVTLMDTNGLLTFGSDGGAIVLNNDASSLSILGTFSEVNNALATLSDTDSSGTTDTITIGATDQFGNVATTPASIAVTVNGLPVIAAPTTTVAAAPGAATPITGVSISESGSPAGDTFNVTLADGHGLLSVSTTSGVTIGGQGTAGLSLTGSLAQINVALGTLSDTTAHWARIRSSSTPPTRRWARRRPRSRSRSTCPTGL